MVLSASDQIRRTSAADRHLRIIQSEIDSHERRLLYYHNARDKLLVALSAGAIGISFTLIITTTIQQQTRSLVAFSWLLFAVNITLTIIGHQLNTIGYKGLFKYHNELINATKDSAGEIYLHIERYKVVISIADIIYYISFAAFFIGLILFSVVGYNVLFYGG